MDKKKIESLLNSLGIDGSKTGESTFDHLVNDLKGTSSRKEFVGKINGYKKFMNNKGLYVDDLRKREGSIYYELRD